MKIKFSTWALALIILSSCSKEESGPTTSGSGNVLDEGVMILNEGQFGTANASITLINDKDEQSDEVFFSVNESSLGDVLNSVTETASNYYLVVNNSKKVEVVNKKSFESEATITGFSSPRCLLDLENGNALVTNFVFDDSTGTPNTIDVVDLNTNTIESSIAVTNTCEGMHLKGETAYVTNAGNNEILLIDRSTLTITGSIPTPRWPKQILEDKNGKLWVLCSGESWNGIPAAILRINPNTKTIEVQNDFITGAYPERIAMNGGGGILFVLSDMVYRTAVSDGKSLQQIPNTNFATYGYALGVDPESTEIYVGDARDFVSKGVVKKFDLDGNLLNTYQSGVVPNGFVFR